MPAAALAASNADDIAGSAKRTAASLRGGAMRSRDEGHAMRIEGFHDPGEVCQRAGQAIHLVDHDHIDKPRMDIRQQWKRSRFLKIMIGKDILHSGGCLDAPADHCILAVAIPLDADTND
jgi:hypothetical protein